ncbi:hypothetical protein V1477_006486 [Vespula maculifrons]|uniref:Uncharacterized protein n=1 Tax=Vespula maculifrons TaxID=7453 RepID=A0ABD2CJQ3_VESMC
MMKYFSYYLISINNETHNLLIYFVEQKIDKNTNMGEDNMLLLKKLMILEMKRNDLLTNVYYTRRKLSAKLNEIWIQAIK